MNARFWVYHPVADTLVKLTMREGRVLRHHVAWATDEGWSSISTRWVFENGIVTRDTVDDGRDCDGRLTRFNQSECSLDSLSVHQFDDVRLPDWTHAESSQRDYSAEAMGY